METRVRLCDGKADADADAAKYLSPILGLGSPQHAPKQGSIETLGRGQPSLNLCHRHLWNNDSSICLLFSAFATNTLYFDVEERRESRPGVEQKMSEGKGIVYWSWYW